MSCYKCATKFGFFKKEVGCSNCGYAFCSKCCDKKANVPKKDNKNLIVCFECFDILTGVKSKALNSNRDLSPPENFKKLVERNSKQTTVTADKHLADRLTKLSETNKLSQNNPIATQDEIESRLNNLMGVNRVNMNERSNLPTQSIIKNSDDLINKYNEEVKIDQHLQEYNQSELEKLEERLRNLSKPIEPSNKIGSSKEEPKTGNDIKPIQTAALKPKIDPTKDLMNKLLQDAELEYKKSQISNHSDDDSEKEKVCCICEIDAIIKCIDCDNDFYCKKCFKQGHDTSTMKKHRTIQVS